MLELNAGNAGIGHQKVLFLGDGMNKMKRMRCEMLALDKEWHLDDRWKKTKLYRTRNKPFVFR
jgi:hypothetical protein